MSMAAEIRCTTCNRTFNLKDINFCPECGRPGSVDARNWTLEVEYDWDKISKTVSKENLPRKNNMWRYLPLLPVNTSEILVSLGEGMTPLIRCYNLEEEFNINRLYIKDETRNPTGSFKDRMIALVFQKARELGNRVLLVVSDGNLGSSAAAYCAKEGKTDCLIMTYPHITEAKLYQMLVYGGQVFDIRGSLKERVELFLELEKRKGWYVVNYDHIGNPYAVEGYKTIAYEVAEQLGWKSPDHIVVPTGSGEGISGVYKGFKELHRLGWIDRIPKVHGAQVEGNDPLVRAVENNAQSIEPLTEMRETIVGGINTDVTGHTALLAVKESGGQGVVVDDREALEGERLMAQKEAVYAEPASGASLYGIKKLREKGLIKENETVVCVVTSQGLKALNATRKIVKSPFEIKPDIEEFDKLAKIKG